MSLLVVGTVAFDTLETPFGKIEKIIGGAATYISLAASYLLPEIRLVSIVGDDFPHETIEAFQNRGIDTSGLQIKSGKKTFFWSGKYHLDMNTRDTVETQLNVLAEFDPILPEHFKDSKYLMLGNLMPSVQQRVLEQLYQRPKLIVLDTMNYWMEHYWDDLLFNLKSVDVLTINDSEARQLSGEYSLVKAAVKILSMGPKYLIIKKGEHGALLFGEGQIFIAPALPLEEVFDPTGAGDTFAGGFISYLARTDDISFENMKRAVIHASAMASFCVEKFGTKRLEELSLDELAQRHKLFRALTHYEMDFNTINQLV